MNGIMFYLTPDWSRLKEARVWGKMPDHKYNIQNINY